jgi:hypothetical protein
MQCASFIKEFREALGPYLVSLDPFDEHNHPRLLFPALSLEIPLFTLGLSGRQALSYAPVGHRHLSRGDCAMDSSPYQTLLKTILQEHESFGTQVGNQPIATHFIYDDDHAEYLMVNHGWNTAWNEAIYGVIFHGWVRDGKVWIAQDLASPSVTSELLQRGVPRADIIPAMEHPYVALDATEMTARSM